MKHLDSFYLFIKVVQQGGFSHAASQLAMPTATLSRRISALEQSLGCKLLSRTTRKLQLTEEGRRYYERLNPLLTEMEQVTGDIQGQRQRMSGLIKVAAPIAISNTFLIDGITDFCLEYPEIRIDLLQSNDYTSLLDTDLDVVFFSGELPDSSLRARRLGEVHYGLFASPRYLELEGMPQEPEALDQHHIIQCWPHRNWQLTHEDGRRFHLKPVPRLSVNQMQSAVKVAIQGLGIVNVPKHYVAHHVDAGLLYPVLPGWLGGKRPFHMVYHNRELAPVRLNTFIEFIDRHMRRRLASTWVRHRQKNNEEE
ncbi:LysR family L-lactate utilization transcriptional regulator [Oceanisphaera litoralis]|uniref:LysR family transcriptional regulator n=1 Tax=Oceanisphaera litoralis TaxID=225144 RepID=UPI00195B7B48|nr:LysR family transcriptional regulator [Oceanisphaera litoralis]MBM7455089.1 LysR family L-lactate utilization transcriptional regulator [Oceanisphaera litoralis]